MHLAVKWSTLKDVGLNWNASEKSITAKMHFAQSVDKFYKVF